jgi:hypothetical protein
LEAAGYTVEAWQFTKDKYILNLKRDVLCVKFLPFN